MIDLLINELLTKSMIVKIGYLNYNDANKYIHLIKKNGTGINIRFSNNVLNFNIDMNKLDEIEHEFYMGNNGFGFNILLNEFVGLYKKNANNLLNIYDYNYFVFRRHQGNYPKFNFYVDIYINYFYPISFFEFDSKKLYLKQNIKDDKFTNFFVAKFYKKHSFVKNFYVYFKIQKNFRIFGSEKQRLKCEIFQLKNYIESLNNLKSSSECSYANTNTNEKLLINNM